MTSGPSHESPQVDRAGEATDAPPVLQKVLVAFWIIGMIFLAALLLTNL